MVNIKGRIKDLVCVIFFIRVGEIQEKEKKTEIYQVIYELTRTETVCVRDF